MGLKQWFGSVTLRTAINLAMKKPSPEAIPLSDWDKVRKRDYFTVYLGDRDDNRRFLAQSAMPSGLTGLWFTGKTTNQGMLPNEACVPFNLIEQFIPEFIFYYRELEFRYKSATKFLLVIFLRIPAFLLAKERIAQSVFNKRRLARTDRITVLRHIFEQTLEDKNFSTNPWDYMTYLHGPRWVAHPDNEANTSYYLLVLKSFAEAGDIEAKNLQFRLKPQGLVTLSSYEEEERRHQDQTKQRRMLGYLTAALVIVGILQAVAVQFSE